MDLGGRADRTSGMFDARNGSAPAGSAAAGSIAEIRGLSSR